MGVHMRANRGFPLFQILRGQCGGAAFHLCNHNRGGQNLHVAAADAGRQHFPRYGKLFFQHRSDFQSKFLLYQTISGAQNNSPNALRWAALL
ncbi:MAG: hypothetical protein ACLSAP_08510, partial [Oscillospiraceae bacterium]